MNCSGGEAPDKVAALRAIRLLRHEHWAFAHRAYATPSLAEKVRSMMCGVLDDDHADHRRPGPVSYEPHRKEEAPGEHELDRPEALRPGRAA